MVRCVFFGDHRTLSKSLCLRALYTHFVILVSTWRCGWGDKEVEGGNDGKKCKRRRVHDETRVMLMLIAAYT